ncbi:MAG TPA: hypothetical protein PLB55_14380 [Prosthecobacter sp.]|nr:hypothetical protein [Prosthecobacter sp.]
MRIIAGPSPFGQFVNIAGRKKFSEKLSPQPGVCRITHINPSPLIQPQSCGGKRGPVFRPGVPEAKSGEVRKQPDSFLRTPPVIRTHVGDQNSTPGLGEPRDLPHGGHQVLHMIQNQVARHHVKDLIQRNRPQIRMNKPHRQAFRLLSGHLQHLVREIYARDLRSGLGHADRMPPRPAPHIQNLFSGHIECSPQENPLLGLDQYIGGFIVRFRPALIQVVDFKILRLHGGGTWIEDIGTSHVLNAAGFGALQAQGCKIGGMK